MHLIVNQLHPCCVADQRRLEEALQSVSIVSSHGDVEYEVVAILFFPHRLQPNQGNRLDFGINQRDHYHDQAFIGPMVTVDEALQRVGEKLIIRPSLVDEIIANANTWIAQARAAKTT